MARTVSSTTFRERQTARQERNLSWHRDHPRSGRALQWLYGFNVVFGACLAVVHAVHLEWSALYWTASALFFARIGWRWRQDQKSADQTRLSVDAPRRGPTAVPQSPGRRRLVTGLVGAGALVVVMSAITVAAGGGGNVGMAIFLSGVGLFASGYSLRR